MRILNIYFKNINSLEGETRIDFTEAPFSDTGVFAITGPNGSGKSSILDAITLGLYGETFRFNKPAEHVMTKQTADCFVIIEFSLGSERYQSSWHVERADGQASGELQPAVMQLVHLNTGDVLATTQQQVCTRMTEITGMNFRNFTRSILLAQGDFAAFLNALDAERMDILEKIISTDIYADYKKQVIDQAEQAQQTIDHTKQKLATIALLPPEKQEAYEHDLIDYQEQSAELLSEQNKLKQQQAAVKEIAFVQAQITVQKKNLKQAETEAQQLQQQLERIYANQNILIFKEEAALINDKNQAIAQSKADLLALQGELVQLKNKLARDNSVAGDLSDKSLTEQQQIISNLKTQRGQLTANAQSEVTLARSLEAQLAEKKAELAVLTTWLNEHAADQSLLTQFPDIGKLNKLQADLLALNTQQKISAKQAKDSVIAFDNTATALEKEQKKLSDATDELAEDQKELTTLMETHTLEQIEALRVEQQERVKSFEELLYLGSAHQRLSKSGFSLFSFFGGKKQPELDVDALTLAHEELKLEVLREENIKKVLEQAVFREGLLKKMADSRQYLIDNKPCFLCGALQHPYSKNPPPLNDSKQALLDQQAKIKNLLAKTYSVGRQVEEARQQSENKQSNWARRQRVSSQWLSLCNRLNAARPDLDIQNIALMEELLTAETEELKNIITLGTRYRNKQNNIAKLTVSIEKSTAIIEQLQSNIASMTADVEVRVQQQSELESRLQQCEQEEQHTLEQVVNQLAHLGEKMPGKDKKDTGDALFERLTARKQEYHSYAFRHSSLTEDIALLTTKHSTCEAEINYYKQQLDPIGAQLQSEESISLHLALLEKQKLIADKERLMLEQSTEIANLQQTLLEKIQATACPSLTALNEMLVLLQRQPALEQQQAQLNTDIAAKKLAMEKTAVELEDKFKIAETALSPDELMAQLKQINERLELAQLEIQRLEKQLNEQKTLQQNYYALQLQLQQQETEAQPCFAELALLSEENGMAFRRRVQQQLANKLLVQTNAILEKISGRYYLRQIPSEQGLALVIEDTLQANAQRFPKTLSGGESFVVSLALALGLAELANNGRSVDSLFIDEGFGNLDAETLYIIISTLENLQTYGKTVGVISHVEAVQKNFKAQLQVVKKPNGMGMLKKAS
ncbi:MAG: AAA family ATPase [Methylococcaceae bacterium]|nr:AAA family ATPase [Methylococcaceae bacterium]